MNEQETLPAEEVELGHDPVVCYNMTQPQAVQTQLQRQTQFRAEGLLSLLLCKCGHEAGPRVHGMHDGESQQLLIALRG